MLIWGLSLSDGCIFWIICESVPAERCPVRGGSMRKNCQAEVEVRNMRAPAGCMLTIICFVPLRKLPKSRV